MANYAAVLLRQNFVPSKIHPVKAVNAEHDEQLA